MSDSTEQRKLAAIMFTDMVCYSALLQRNDKLAQELLEENRQLLRQISRAFTGQRLKPSAFFFRFIRDERSAIFCSLTINEH